MTVICVSFQRFALIEWEVDATSLVQCTSEIGPENFSKFELDITSIHTTITIPEHSKALVWRVFPLPWCLAEGLAIPWDLSKPLSRRKWFRFRTSARPTHQKVCSITLLSESPCQTVQEEHCGPSRLPISAILVINQKPERNQSVNFSYLNKYSLFRIHFLLLHFL